MTDNQSTQSATNPALIIAVLWAIASVIIGLVFILGTPSEAYGGDAYTGIQGATAQTARAIGFLIIGTGALGLIVATNRPSQVPRVTRRTGDTPSHMDEDGM